MKPTLMIIIPLILFIGLSIFSLSMMNKDADKLSNQIDQLDSFVSDKNWEKASTGISNLSKTWKPIRKRWETLIDHIEVDRIDTSLARIKQLAASKEEADCLAEIAALKQSILHIPEKDKISFSTIF